MKTKRKVRDQNEESGDKEKKRSRERQLKADRTMRIECGKTFLYYEIARE